MFLTVFLCIRSFWPYRRVNYENLCICHHSCRYETACWYSDLIVEYIWIWINPLLCLYWYEQGLKANPFFIFIFFNNMLILWLFQWWLFQVFSFVVSVYWTIDAVKMWLTLSCMYTPFYAFTNDSFTKVSIFPSLGLFWAWVQLKALFKAKIWISGIIMETAKSFYGILLPIRYLKNYNCFGIHGSSMALAEQLESRLWQAILCGEVFQLTWFYPDMCLSSFTILDVASMTITASVWCNKDQHIQQYVYISMLFSTNLTLYRILQQTDQTWIRIFNVQHHLCLLTVDQKATQKNYEYLPHLCTNSFVKNVNSLKLIVKKNFFIN